MKDWEIIKEATGMDKNIYAFWKKSPLSKQIHLIIKKAKQDFAKEMYDLCVDKSLREMVEEIKKIGYPKKLKSGDEHGK